jgi:hypothetical protein
MLRRLLSSLVLALAACQDGQSGSERVPTSPTSPEPAPVPPGIPPLGHCPCSALGDFQAIRARVLGSEAFPEVGTTRYELIVEELLGPDPSERNELSAGDQFGGYWDGQLACVGENPTGGEIEPDSTVLAFYRRGYQDNRACCEYIDCLSACRESLDDPSEDCEADCAGATADACSAHREEAILRGELILIPWGDEFAVGVIQGATVSLKPDQIPLLAGRDRCESSIPNFYQAGEDGPASEGAPGGPPPGEAPPASPAEPPTASASTPTPTAPMPGTPAPPATTPDPTPAAPTATSPESPPPPNRPSGPPPEHPEDYDVRCANTGG